MTIESALYAAATHFLAAGGGATLLHVITRKGITLNFGKNGHAQRIAKAGEQSVDFWERKFDKLSEHGTVQTELLKRQTEILDEQTKLLTELVTISRRNGHARKR